MLVQSNENHKQIYPVARGTFAVEKIVEEVKRTYNLLFDQGTVVELRVLETEKGTVLGYYDEPERLARDAALWSGLGVGVYITIQKIDPRLLLANCNAYKTYAKKGEGTQTANVQAIINLPIDFDHKRRPKGVSATDAEVQECLARADECRAYLRGLGWAEPVFACSGNGGHLVYRVSLSLDDHKLFVKVYKHIQKKFEDDRIGVDQSVSDLAQIWKLYGTKTKKGMATEECPHRHAQIIEAPESLGLVTKEQLLALVEAPVETKAGAFDRAMRAAGITDEAEAILNQDQAAEFREWQDAREDGAWVRQFSGDLTTLDIFGLWEDVGLEIRDDGVCECPWADEHTVETTGTKVWEAEEGERFPGFNCKHSHCEGRGLREVLEKFGKDRVDKHCSRMFQVARPTSAESGDGEEPDPVGEAKAKGGRPSVSAAIVKMVEQQALLLRADDGTPYARVLLEGHRETMAVDSDGFKSWLYGEYYLVAGKPPGADAVREAVQVVKYLAGRRPRRAVHLRWAHLGDRIYLDLGNDGWDAVEIDRDGWRVVPEPPVVFRRVANTAALPYPARGGSLDDLRPFFTGTDDDFVLYAGSILAAVTQGPYFVTCFHGEQGSAKTWACRFPKRLLDPVGGAELNNRLPREIDKDFINGVMHDHVIAFDNVSSITTEVSDFLCTLSTGGGIRVRELYTNEGQKVYDLRRPLYLNGIPDFNERPDLKDRALTIHMPVLTEKKAEDALEAEWLSARPRILGGLLDKLSAGLRQYGSTPTPGTYRMAGAVRWVNACLGHGRFEGLYAENRRSAAEHGLECSPVAPALMGFLEAPGPIGAGGSWRGKPSDLLQAVLQYALSTGLSLGKGFPERANAFSGEVMRILPGLREHGIEAAKKTVRGVAVYEFEVRGTEGFTEEGVAMTADEPAPIGDEAEKDDPPARPDKTPKYSVGQRVRIAGIDEPMEVVDTSVYGPDTQSFMVCHRDPTWEPPDDPEFIVNRNYGPPRLWVGLRNIRGAWDPLVA